MCKTIRAVCEYLTEQIVLRLTLRRFLFFGSSLVLLMCIIARNDSAAGLKLGSDWPEKKGRPYPYYNWSDSVVEISWRWFGRSESQFVLRHNEIELFAIWDRNVDADFPMAGGGESGSSDELFKWNHAGIDVERFFFCGLERAQILEVHASFGMLEIVGGGACAFMLLPGSKLPCWGRKHGDYRS